MSLDDRIRAARPASAAAPFDLDAMLGESMRAGRRRRLKRRASTAAAAALTLALVSVPLMQSMYTRDADIADRIQNEEQEKNRSPVPTATRRPGSGPGTKPTSVPPGGAIGGGTPPPAAAGTTRTISPDRIAFVSAEPSTEIYTMLVDGSQKKRLAAGSEPDWSPDGKHIAYSRGRTSAGCTSTTARVNPPDPCEIWVMDADGSNQRRLVAGWSPDWSPDGRRIAYASGYDTSEVYVMNADGSGSVRITTTENTSPSTQGSNSPSWSPDGQWIAISRRAKCGGACWTNHLYVVRSDGSQLNELASLTESVQPAWSGDGTRIAFVARGQDNAEIFTVEPDGDDVRRLTHDAPGDAAMDNYDGAPAWSPGGRLAFVSDPDGPSDSGTCAMSGLDAQCGVGGPAPPRISLMNADGSAVIEIGEGRMPDFAPRRP